MAEPAVSVVGRKDERMTRPLLFISYSQRDERELQKLLTHLDGLKQLCDIEPWHDAVIGPGAYWEQSIIQAIDHASVAILLVTEHFLTSDFINREEVPRLLRRHQEKELVLYPIVCRECVWKVFDWLAEIQVRPKNGIPVWKGSRNSSRVDEALVAIVYEIAGIVRRGSA